MQQIDDTNGTTYLKDILNHAKLTERHKKLIEQQTTSTKKSQHTRNDSMKNILFDLFLFALGAGFGAFTMCFMQTAKAADREIEMMEKRKK